MKLCSAQILAILRPPGIWPVPSREGQHLCISKVFQQPLIFSLFYLSLWHSHCIPFVLSLAVMMRMRWVTTADYGFLYGENYFFKKWFFLEPYKLNVVVAEKHMLLRNEMPLWIIIICFPPSALKKEDTNADIRENMMEDSNIIGIWLYSHCTVAWRDQECEVKLLRKKISYFLVGILYGSLTNIGGSKIVSIISSVEWLFSCWKITRCIILQDALADKDGWGHIQFPKIKS